MLSMLAIRQATTKLCSSSSRVPVRRLFSSHNVRNVIQSPASISKKFNFGKKCISAVCVSITGVVVGYKCIVSVQSPFEYYGVVVHADTNTGDDFQFENRRGKIDEYAGGDGVKNETLVDHENHASDYDPNPEIRSTEKKPGISKSENEEHFDWAQLLEIISPHWRRLLVAVGAAFLVAIINIEIPSCLGKLVDAVTFQLMANGNSTTKDVSSDFMLKLKEPATKLVTLYLAQAIGTFTYIYNLSVIGEGMAKELRNRLYTSLLNQEVAFFDSHMTGEVASRLTADIQEFKSSFKQCISQGLRSVSQVLGCVVSLYFVSKEMTVTVVAIVPAIILLGSLFTRGLRKLSRKAQSQLAESSGHAEETLANIRTVKAFAMEEYEIAKYNQQIKQLKKSNVELGVGIGIFQAGSNLFLNGIILGVMYTGGKLIAAQKLSSGDLMSFLVASQTIQRSLANMSLLFGQYVRGIGAGTRVFHYINLKPEISEDHQKNAEIPSTLHGDIEFKNVYFSYPTRQQKLVLKDFSLKLPKGKVVAVVGASGSGKSTLVNILEGFYTVHEGSILLDGVPIERLSTKWLRGEAIGLINQEPILFATSILENIRYGKPSATDAEIFEAAKRANAYDFIMEFPQKFATKLGERGVTVSGGQKQRIAIARALVKQPKILILDEATSALDADSERVVQKALDSAVQGRTVLVIAHRLSTIKNADVIAVLSKGTVVEIGTHETLMQRKGFYYGLVKQQEFLTKNQ